MSTSLKKLFLLFLSFCLVFIISYAYAEEAAPPPEAVPDKTYAGEFLKPVLQPGASCITGSCHEEMVRKKYLHAAGVDGMKCNRCHEIITPGTHEFKKISEVTVNLCAQCHRADVIPPAGLKGTPPKVISPDEAKILHKPFAEGKCTACHDAHSSNYYTHLKYSFPEGIYASFDDKAYGLCIHCHKDLEKMLTEPRTLSDTMFRNGNVNLHYRHVDKTKGRSCKVCHDPHGVANPKLMKDTFLFGKRMLTIDFEKTETGGQCATTCHRSAKYDRYNPAFNFINIRAY